jgi:hypothetical protein
MTLFRNQFTRPLCALALCCALVPAAVHAQADAIEPEAIKLLQRATDYLASQKQFRVDTDSTIEIVLRDGQKLQFDHRVALTVRRPNGLRAERIGDLAAQTFYYDGKSLSVYMPGPNYYATSPVPPTLEGMLDVARDKLGVVAPAADLVYGNAFERLTEGLTSAYVVGDAVIGGVRTTHLAFRNAAVDWQIWIEQGKQPLPRKFVVTSKRMEQSPQFIVTLSNFKPLSKVGDEVFRFVPPKGARQIDFVTAPTGAGK